MKQETIDTLNGIGRYGHNVAHIFYGDDGEATLNFCRRYDLIENNMD